MKRVKKGIPDNLCRICRKRISKGEGTTRRYESGKKAALHTKCVKVWDELEIWV